MRTPAESIEHLERHRDPSAAPAHSMPAFHFENHMYHEVSCSLGESCFLVLCFFPPPPSEKGPERKKPEMKGRNPGLWQKADGRAALASSPCWI